MNPWKPISAIALAAVTVGCSSVSIDDLTRQVRTSMEEKYRGTGIQIRSFTLTKMGGNEYSGILETKEPNGQFTYRVEVLCDGKSFNWQTKPM